MCAIDAPWHKLDEWPDFLHHVPTSLRNQLKPQIEIPVGCWCDYMLWMFAPCDANVKFVCSRLSSNYDGGACELEPGTLPYIFLSHWLTHRDCLELKKDEKFLVSTYCLFLHGKYSFLLSQGNLDVKSSFQVQVLHVDGDPSSPPNRCISNTAAGHATHHDPSSGGSDGLHPLIRRLSFHLVGLATLPRLDEHRFPHPKWWLPKFWRLVAKR